MTDNQLNTLFLRLAEELDISDTLFDKAEKSYEALGEYIGNHCDYSTEIYTQGSFRLGTVVRPLSEEDEYDLDIVCEISDGQSLDARSIKTLIGDILRASDRYSSMLEEKKRSWRIEYSDEAQFHMDITPAKPDTAKPLSIQVTNKDEKGIYSFDPSNPKGYEEWFVNRKRINILEKAFALDSASIEPVKEHKTKMPLQRAIQVLKRHRDKMFEENSDNAPISIIITTLSAHAYNGETGVFDALKRILSTMPQFIYKNGNEYKIPNPSNTEENFAEKWNEEPAKATAFFEWLAKVRRDIIETTPTITDDYTYFEEVFGEGAVGRAVSAMNPVQHDSHLPETAYNDTSIKTVLEVSHRQKPTFGLPKGYSMGVNAMYTQNGQIYEYKNNGQAIPKECSLDFNLIVSRTLLKGNYTVLWQVVNTGEEARALGVKGLRGGFEKEYNSTKRHESTMYTGKHFIQAFLLKNSRCIARSQEFIVNIQ